MERKIGETFEFKGKTYEVIESLSNICDNCAFSGECDATETVVGSCSCTSRLDGKNVIFKEIKDNKLTINIPDGMEIDLQNSNFDAGVIKFKKKELTYEDIENSLKLSENMICISVDGNNSIKLSAINRLMCIAKFYNGDWKPDWESPDSLKFYILYDTLRGKYDIEFSGSSVRNDVYFKNKKMLRLSLITLTSAKSWTQFSKTKQYDYGKKLT